MAALAMRFVGLMGQVLGRAWQEFRKLSGRSQALVALGVVLVLVTTLSTSLGSSASSAAPLAPAAPSLKKPQDPGTLRVITWNIAAINNNPFEYWLTYKDDPKYDQILNDVQAFVVSPPAKKDVLVGDLFTAEMVDKLIEQMANLKFENLDEVKEMYVVDWSKRKIVSDFLKNPDIGRKRLVSMPDRVTNTIITKKGTFNRPTPISCYAGPRLTTLGSWYELWLKFMFSTKVNEKGQVPAQLLTKIPRAKYPALTEEEERLSIPLQTLIIAIFDAIQVRMLNQIAGAEEWQKLRDNICANLNSKKSEKTLSILTKSYSDANIMLLQETAASFIGSAKDALGSLFHVVAPAQLGKNDQNSLILLSKKKFDSASVEELTTEALDILKKDKSPVAAGDLLVIRVRDVKGQGYFLASFHGDTNGLATIPVVKAVRAVFRERAEPTDRFIFGMDANTYESPPNTRDYQEVLQFVQFFTEEEQLSSCWGEPVDPKRHTTRNARTYMQPQLSKAASKNEIEAKGDANPKDFILFDPSQLKAVRVARDNTGTGAFIAGMVFPTLDFPSDHAILRTVLVEQGSA